MNFFFEIWNEAIFLWEKGGILMPAIGILSLYTYFVAFDLWFRLRTILPKDIQSFPREKWAAFQGGKINVESCITVLEIIIIRKRLEKFQQVRKADSSYLSRRLRFLLVLAAAAPLIGLLGTVSGMLRTFDGLSMQDGYKMDLVASGISEALVTTQAGLLVAIPALAFSHLLNRKRKDWLHCINRLESISLRQIRTNSTK